MTVVTPLRFVSGVIGLWVVGRVIALTPDPMGTRAEADVVAERPAIGHLAASAYPPAASPGPIPQAGRSVALRLRDARARGADPEMAPAAGVSALLVGTPRKAASAPDRLRAPDPALRVAAIDPGPSPGGIVPAREAPMPPAPATNPAMTSRWSGSLYLYRRGDGGDGGDALASGGQLGGSQAGARITYRLNPTGPARFGVAARISVPLDDRRGAEAAAGLDWHPLPGRPLRVSIERREDIGGAGRNAWSAYAAGGFWREPRPGFVVDGYAQAGIVGARRGDLFADGALRAGGRRELGGGRSLTLGGGMWGAAQPRVARIDIGPRAALGLPLAGTAATLAAEWRIRVGGDASPRSGLAITLAADF